MGFKPKRSLGERDVLFLLRKEELYVILAMQLFAAQVDLRGVQLYGLSVHLCHLSASSKSLHA
jgi:hypothetical protein